ncbi:MAG: TolC family protein [Candidatus Acidiferrales bacterium]
MLSIRAIGVTVALALALPAYVAAQSSTGEPGQPQPPVATGVNGPVRISLDDAIQLALQHNHTLKAEQSTIQQNEAQEITANLRPNPTLSGDAQFLPFFQPGAWNATYIENNAQFDIGLGYLFERGKKRQHRLQAAKDATAVTRSTVADNERTLVFNVAQQFISVQLAESTLNLSQQDLKSFQNSVDISQARYKAGDISEGDFLKIKLQLLQFQTDVSQAQLAKVQALVGLRQFLGYESVPQDFDVTSDFDYVPVKLQLEDLQAKALQNRPDFRAAQLGITAAQSQYELAKANGKRDVTASLDYSHTGNTNSASAFGSIDLPIFDRNQGEIARTKFAILQAQELERASSDQVLSDVLDAYENVRDNDQIIQLYRTGYLDEAKNSRDISEYAYKRGAASLLDYLDAERSYRAIELSYRQSLASYITAVEQLREAVGSRNLP